MVAGVVVTAGGVPAVGKGDSGGGGGLGGHLALFRLVIAALQGCTYQLRWCSTTPFSDCHMPVDTQDFMTSGIQASLTTAGANASPKHLRCQW